jgi:hypothetical protein
MFYKEGRYLLSPKLFHVDIKCEKDYLEGRESIVHVVNFLD